MEGLIGVPAPGVNDSYLWLGVHTSDTHLSAIEGQLGPRLSTIEGQLGSRLENIPLLLQRGVNRAHVAAGGAVQKIRGLEAAQNLSSNSAVKARLYQDQALCAQLAQDNRLLRDGLDDVSRFIVGMMEGRIPMASPPSQTPISPSIPAGMVSRAVFDTHIAEQKREMALPNQQISGGG